MASITEAIRRLVIQATSTGLDEVRQKLLGVSTAQDGVTVASERTERATLSSESAFAKLERQHVNGLRAQQQYEKAQRQINQAVAQNPALQERANVVLAAMADKYVQATGAQKAFGIATQTVNLQIASLASGLGVTGQILSAFGPWGFAAAVGIGMAGSAFSLASDKAHQMAQKAKEISEFSEATGLTTRQFQALRSEAGKFGVDSEQMATGISKFTAGFEGLRQGSGDLLTQIRRINPALAEQMQRTTDTATAFTLFGKAVAETDNIFQRNALLKAGMGRGAMTFGAFFQSAPDVAALTAAFDAAGRGLDANLIPKLKQLQIDIDKTKSATSAVFAGMFGTATLEGEKRFAEGLLEITKWAASFKLSEDLRKFIDFKMSPVEQSTVNVMGGAAGGLMAGAATGAAAGGAIGLFGGPIGAGVGAAIGGLGGAIVGAIYAAVQEVKPGSLVTPSGPSMANFQSPANSYSTFQASASVPQPKTDQATLADMEKRIALLGSAATATDKYAVALKKLEIGQDGVKLSGNDLTRATASIGLEKATALVSAHNSALGASMSVQDAVNARTLELQRLQQQGAGLTPKQIADQQSLARENALGTANIKAQIDATTVQTATIGMSAGAAAEYTVRQTLMNDAIRKHKDLTAADIAEIDAQARALRKVVEIDSRKQIQSQIKFDRATAGFSPEDVQIAQALRGIYPDIATAMNSVESAGMRLNNQLRDVRDTGVTFATDFVHALQSGNSVMASLQAAASKLGQSLVDIGIKRLATMGMDTLTKGFMDTASGTAGGAANGAALSAGAAAAGAQLTAAATAAAGILAGGGTAAAAPIGVVVPGAAVTMAVSGAAAGGEVASGGLLASIAMTTGGAAAGTALWGPIAAIAAILVGLGLMSGGGEDKVVKAKKTWEEAGPAFQKFLTEMSGGVQGDLAAKIQSARATMVDLATKAWDAQDYASLSRIQGEYVGFTLREAGKVQAMFAATVQGLADGLGPDSPFFKAVSDVKSHLETVQKIIDDAATSNATEYMSSQVDVEAARAASMSFMISLLQTAPKLSGVQTAMLNIQGTATALQGALTQLGMSSAEAAYHISAGVGAAIAKLKETFESGLSERLNTANGKSYFNDTAALIAQHAQDLADAAMLGTDAGLVASLFHAEAQKIVEDAGLVGESFQEFSRRFPELAGIVTQSSDALAAAAKTQQDALNSSAKTILEYVNSLASGSGSTLSPRDRLNAAQTAYDAQLALAQSGNLDAQSGITKYAEDLRSAARDFYGSTSAYQTIITDLTSQLRGLPAVEQATDPVVMALNAAVTAIYGTTTAVQGTTGAVNSNTTSTNATVVATSAQQEALIAAQNVLAANQISYLQAQQTLLGAIRELTGATRDQVSLLREQLTNNAVSASFTAVSGNNDNFTTYTTINNNLLTALNKIVLSTYATAMNTFALVQIDSSAKTLPHGYGALASGGWITGGIPGRDSVMLGSGNALGMPGEFVVRHDVAQANKSWLPDFNETGRLPMPRLVSAPMRAATNDNGDVKALIAEVRELRSQLAKIESNTGRTVGAVAGAAELLSEKIEEGTALQRDNNKLLRRKA